jgi:hypothetical protein
MSWRPLLFAAVVSLGAVPSFAQGGSPRLTVSFSGPQPYTCLAPNERTFFAGDPFNGVTVTTSKGYVTENFANGGARFQAYYGCSGFFDHTLQLTFNHPVADIDFELLTYESTLINGRFFGAGHVHIDGPVSFLGFSGSGPHADTFGWGFTVWSMSFVKTEIDLSQFGFSPAATNQVLIHKYGGDSYPDAQLQTADGSIRVEGFVRDPLGNPVSGKTVYFRLIDPPDPAAYVVAGGDSHTGDNADGRGTLNGAATTTAVSGADGKVTVTLGITDHAAGDNYRIEASMNAMFNCPPPGCAQSATYTAWKRAYVAVYKMFRRGAFLSQPVNRGDRVIRVDDVRALPNPPFKVRLIHAPPANGAGSSYSEDFTITNITGGRFLTWGQPQPGILTVDPNGPAIGNSYDAPPAINNTARTYLADAVGAITGVRANDFYLPNGTLVNNEFNRASTEYVWLTDAGTNDADLTPTQPRLSFDGEIPYRARLNSNETGWMTLKWLAHATRGGALTRSAFNNHEALFVAADTLSPGFPGETNVGNGYNDTWLFTSNLGAGLREATVHELAHQWLVNPLTPTLHGHCDQIFAFGGFPFVQFMFDHPNLQCTMTSTWPASSSQLNDGIVGFHYIHLTGIGAHSEYLTIRRRPEPTPQNELTRRVLP